MTRLLRDRFEAWSVASLESAPALIRGLIRASMRKGTPENVQPRILVITKDEKAWKQAIGAKQDAVPTVVVLNGKGGIASTYEGEFAEAPYQKVKSKLDLAAALR